MFSIYDRSQGYFNPRPREEGDVFAIHILSCSDISIHALVKRATTLALSYCADIRISIHALVKRATSVISCTSRNSCISIHALVKRATFLNFLTFPNTFYFNPRPREEGDRIPWLRRKAQFISIHALVKRATSPHLQTQSKEIFQSTPS